MRKRHARFLFAPLLILPSVGATPALADATSAAAFVQETCVAHIDDLSKLDDLAKEKGWQQIANLGGNVTGAQFNSTGYQAKEGDQSYMLTIVSIGQGKACAVTFKGDQDVKRDEFFNAISAGVELKLVPGMTVARNGAHVDTYEIQSDQPKKKILQLSWGESGNVLLSVNIFAGQ
jgi:hypothetical protein